MSTALAFQSTTFDVIDRNGQPWLKASQLATALGYSQEGKVSRLYDRHADEFTASMTQVIEIGTESHFGTGRCRIFSLRGCHLLAMFARTQIAKAFRVWVLDVLENMDRVGQRPSLDTTSRLSIRSDPERKELTNAINAWVGCAPIHYAQARMAVNSHFGVKSVDELTVRQVGEATEFVYSRIAAIPKPAPLSLPEPQPVDVMVAWLRMSAKFQNGLESFATLSNMLYRLTHDAQCALIQMDKPHIDGTIDAVFALSHMLENQHHTKYAFVYALDAVRKMLKRL